MLNNKADTSTFKPYPTHAKAVVEALQDIFQKGMKADKAVEKILKSDKRRGAKDRAFIAEQTYEIVRWYRLLTQIAENEPSQDKDWFSIMGVFWILQGHILPAWKEFEFLSHEKVFAGYQLFSQHRAIVESIPDWLDELGERELGTTWTPLLHALNKPASLVLRVNTLKTNLQSAKVALEMEGIATIKLSEEGLCVPKRKNIFLTNTFKEGLIEVQDFGSQQIASFLEVEPGMKVIDACAGAGGKTLHLASLMRNKGQIISMDIHEKKIMELQRRARRNGVDIIQTRIIASNKTIKRLKEKADRLLLDVPCSGLGVLRRNPDAKWKLTLQFLEELKITQQHILRNYSSMVKPGGKMVYATCSILPSENEHQIDAFLDTKEGKSFTLEDKKTLLPSDFGYDGFFMARLIRNFS
jgi:16S rRNA (cytosine967-C5)-methyltransferase